MNLQEYLGRHHVPFEVLHHRPTYEAQRMAHAVHTSGYLVAKTVLLRVDGGQQFVVAVLPATHRVEMQRVREVLACGHVQLASEEEVAKRCPDCERGALPPFGSLYGMRTLVDRALVEDEQIVFEGNTHDEAICMTLTDFQRIEHAQVCDIAEHA
jgi:Ala-tRNA(Pro) deacylase